MHSYSKGTLLWIDDDFASGFIKHKDQETDPWRRTFGDAENRIYRLFGLNLEIATDLQNAFEAIEQLTSSENRDRYVQAIVDLRLPRNHSDPVPHMANGIQIALRLQERGVPFVFLSSARPALDTLTELRLDQYPYYRKAGRDNPTMMPDDLVRRVLFDFRNHISWLDLAPLLNKMTLPSNFPLAKNCPWGRYFPFFGSYRDYVERWENRSGRQRNMCTVLRAPASHNDAFVTQCLLFVAASTMNADSIRFIYVSSRDQNAPAVLEGLRNVNPEVAAPLYLSIRFTCDDPEQEKLLLLRILEEFRGTPVAVVLPQDERADELLTTLALEPDVVFDDMPTTRLNDRTAREELIQRSSAFAVQSIRIKDAENTARPLNRLFLRDPNCLVHPTSWTFLNEAKEIDDEISDPYEILLALGEAFGTLESVGGENAENLLSGRPPLDIGLLWPGRTVYEKVAARHPIWIARSLHTWLRTSWRSPWGVAKSNDDVWAGDLVEQWEVHCLKVAIDLAQEFVQARCSNLPREEIDGEPFEIRNLVAVANFLIHKAVRHLLAGAAQQEDWVGFEALRWPHASYPMPAALNRLLKREGRYLWVQTDFLEYATIIEGGRRALERLEHRAETHYQRVAWLEKVEPTLPLGWREPLAEILEVLRNRQIDEVWHDDRRRMSMWYALYSFVQNGVPLSFVFHALHSKEQGLKKDDVTDLIKTQGEGKLLGIIRGRRSATLKKHLAFSDSPSSSWYFRLREAQSAVKFLQAFTRFPGHQEFIGTMAGDFQSAIERFCGVEVEGEQAVKAGALVKPGLQKELMDIALDLSVYDKQRAFFDKGFEGPANGGSLLQYGAVRSTALDLFMTAANATEYIRFCLRPIVYADGYHFLALMRDIRNRGSGGKDMVPAIPVTTLHTVMELFLLGFEGLVAQMKAVLSALGYDEISGRIPLSTQEIVGQPATKGRLADAVQVRVLDENRWELFTLGIGGQRAREGFCYAQAQKGLVFLTEGLEAVGE